MMRKKTLALLLAVIMALSVPAYALAESDISENLSSAESSESASAVSNDDTGLPYAQSTESSSGSTKYYMDYLAEHASADTVSDTVDVDILSPSLLDNADISSVLDKQAIVIQQGGYAEWTFDIQKEGFYYISVDYVAIEGKPIDVETSLQIDGATPYAEASTITFSRIWTDIVDSESDTFPKRDGMDNEITPDSEEVQRWTAYTIHDNDYMTDADLKFYLTAGSHTVRFTSQREAIAFSAIRFGGSKKLPSYSEVKAEYDAKGYKPVGAESNVIVDAEYSYERSQQSLVMVADHSSASTTPAHYSKIRLNTIGGENWKAPNEWISWQVTVPEDGLYTITFKYRQDYVRGFKVYRTVYVDDEIPYEELKTVAFNPNTKWENYTVSDESGNPYYIYLTAGQTHTIKLDVTLGPVADTLQILQNRINDMNSLYLQIIQITGTSPDSLRDYDLDKEIPGLMDNFASIREDLYQMARDIEQYNGVKGGLSSFIDVVVKQLDGFAEDPLKISTGLSTYKSNISSLSDMLVNMKNQSLLLDSIYLGDAQSAPDAAVGFFTSLVFSVKGFFSSFVEDYNAFGNVYDGSTGYKCDPIEVWIGGAGRDQMNVLKTMVDDKFVPQYNIPVNISLVDTGAALTKAILAGAGPDCALMVTSATPVTYSMRGALVDLQQFDGFQEAYSWFYPSAFIALRYQDGGVYGLPETQTFKMMFYRTDIFEDLGIEVPNTWDEVYDCVTLIQRKNMQIGIPPQDQNMFITLLFQNGGNYYSEDKSTTRFNEQSAVEAFKTWTEFNTKYSLPLAYDPLNRFRSGEIPILLESYTFYNNLSVGAPEIKGLWAMAPIPGTVQEDGSINRSQGCDGTVCVMIRGAENQDCVFEFMKWWVSKDAQAEFGNKIEARLGAGGRYATANREAFELIPWSHNEQQNIKEAWEHVSDVDKVPGDYYVTRMLSNAFRAVVYKGQNAREALLKYNKEMNKEIQRKRQEYGIDKYYE